MSPVQENQKTAGQETRASPRIRDSNFIEDLAKALSTDTPDERFGPLARTYRYSASDFCDLALMMKLPRDEAFRIMGGHLTEGSPAAQCSDNEIRLGLMELSRGGKLKSDRGIVELYDSNPQIEHIMSAIDRHYAPLVAGRELESVSIRGNDRLRVELLVRQLGKLADNSTVSGFSLLNRTWKELEGTAPLERVIAGRYQDECNLKDTRASMAGSLETYKKALSKPESHEMMPLFFDERAEILKTLCESHPASEAAKRNDVRRDEALNFLEKAGVSDPEGVLEKALLDTHKERRSDILLPTALRETGKKLKAEILARLGLDESGLKWDEHSSSWQIAFPEKRRSGDLLTEIRQEEFFAHAPRTSLEFVSVTMSGCIVRASAPNDYVTVSFIDHGKIRQVSAIEGRWIGNDVDVPGSVTVHNAGTEHVIGKNVEVFTEHVDRKSVLLDGGHLLIAWNVERGESFDVIRREEDGCKCLYKAGSKTFSAHDSRAHQVNRLNGIKKKDGTEIITANLNNGLCEVMHFDGNRITVLGWVPGAIERMIEGPSGEVLLAPFFSQNTAYLVSAKGLIEDHKFPRQVSRLALLPEGSVMALLEFDHSKKGEKHSFWVSKKSGFAQSVHIYDSLQIDTRSSRQQPNGQAFLGSRFENGKEVHEIISFNGTYVVNCPLPPGLDENTFMTHEINGKTVCMFKGKDHVVLIDVLGNRLQTLHCPGVREVFNTENGIAVTTDSKAVFFEAFPEGKKDLSIDEKELLELLNIMTSKSSERALKWANEHQEAEDNGSSRFQASRMTELTEKYPRMFLDSLRADVRKVGPEKLERLFRLWFPEEVPAKKRDKGQTGTAAADELAPSASTPLDGGDPQRRSGTPLFEITNGYQGFLVSDLYFDWEESGLWSRGDLKLGRDTGTNEQTVTYKIPSIPAGKEIRLPMPPGGQMESAELETSTRSWLFLSRKDLSKVDLKADSCGLVSTSLPKTGLLTCTASGPGTRPLPGISSFEYKELLQTKGFKAFKSSVNRQSDPEGHDENALTKTSHPLPTEALIKLREIKDLPPARKAHEIALWLREAGYYDMENGGTLDEKDGAAPCSRFQYMRERAVVLQSENPEAMKGKLFAGVCADFAALGAAMMRKAGIASGVAVGFLASGRKVSAGDRHSVTVALLGADKNGLPVPTFFDCTPSGGESGLLTNIELPEVEVGKKVGEAGEKEGLIPPPELPEVVEHRKERQAEVGETMDLLSMTPVDELTDRITGVFRNCYLAHGVTGWEDKFKWYLPAPKLFESERESTVESVRAQLERFLARHRDTFDPEPGDEIKMLKRALILSMEYGRINGNQKLVDTAEKAMICLDAK